RGVLRADGADEVGQFAPERLVALDGQGPSLDAGTRAIMAHEPPALDLLRGIVDREIRVGLKEPDLPDALAADAAGGHIRNAPVREAQPGIRDVELRGQH